MTTLVTGHTFAFIGAILSEGDQKKGATMKGCWLVAVLAVFAGLIAVPTLRAAEPWGDVPRVSPKELNAVLTNPDITIIDVRSPHDWEAATQKIKGAVREEPWEVGQWARKYPRNNTIILYCS